MINRKKSIHTFLSSMLLLAVTLTGCGVGTNSGVIDKDTSTNEVNVYSSRHYDVDKVLFKEFEQDTGIKVNIVEGKSEELLERMSREGDASQADLFIAVGAENISLLNEKDLLQPIQSEVINNNIPEEYRGDYWVGLTQRARIIAYAKDRVDPSELSTYEDLTSDKWKGKIVVRSSSSAYNQALLGSFIQLEGEEDAREWAKDIVANFARQPEGNDRDQIKAIAAGIGDIAIVNSYYVSKMIYSSDTEEVKAGESVGIFFPGETHVNLSWGGVTKNSRNKENAVQLLEYLTEVGAQEAYSNDNGEYPLNQNAKTSELLRSWGSFDRQKADFERLGENTKKAMLVFDQVGWK